MSRSNFFRPVVENLEGRAMMSATLPARLPEPVELVVTMKDVLVSSYHTGDAVADTHGTGISDQRFPASSGRNVLSHGFP